MTDTKAFCRGKSGIILMGTKACFCLKRRQHAFFLCRKYHKSSVMKTLPEIQNENHAALVRKLADYRLCNGGFSIIMGNSDY